jgi:hypothetical protein
MILSPTAEIISGNPALEALDKFLVRKQVQTGIIITGPGCA